MLIDMHFHIGSRYHPTNLEDTLKDIEKNRILVAVQGCDIPTSEEAFEIAKRSDFIFPGFGVLPWYAHEYVPRLEEMEKYLGSVGMLGEIGLDYNYSPPEATPSLQKELLEFFLKDAEANDKILNLHIRGASEDTLEILSSYNVHRVIFHAHNDSLKSIREANDRGYFITVNPMVLTTSDTDRKDYLATVVKEISSGSILSEIDTVPRDYKPPSEILKPTLDYIAKLRNVSVEDLKDTIQTNTIRLMDGIPLLATYTNLLR